MRLRASWSPSTTSRCPAARASRRNRACHAASATAGRPSSHRCHAALEHKALWRLINIPSVAAVGVAFLALFLESKHLPMRFVDDERRSSSELQLWEAAVLTPLQGQLSAENTLKPFV
eukprot:3196030-Pleurochrysis_carterae.AAC.3